MTHNSQSVALSGRRCSILGMRVDELNYDSVLTQVRKWSAEPSSRYMCISTVHMVMETYDDPQFRGIVNGADLVGADGVPVIWASRHLGLTEQRRVFAPELLIKLCEMASLQNIPVGFYGSTDKVIEKLARNVRTQFPTLQVAFTFSPPFRSLTSDEDEEIVRKINESGARILFVGLGCPKQERWMNEHRGRVRATMLGVGWAFDVAAGESKTAPGWVQNIGMEWFLRLILNPRKLWRRHLKHNPRFIVLILRQLWGASVSPTTL